MTDGSLAMHEARQAAGQRRRALVLAATDAALQRSAHPSIAGIARSAGVGRKFIYDHPDDLRAAVELKLSQGAKAQAADLVSTAQVSAASLRAELENSRAQCQRLSRQVRFLEDRLSRAEGNRLASDGLLPDASSPGSPTEGWRRAFPSWNNSSSRPGRRFAARPRSSKEPERSTASSCNKQTAPAQNGKPAVHAVTGDLAGHLPPRRTCHDRRTSWPQLRITVTAEVPEEPGQEYTAVEMLLALTNGLRVRGVTPSVLNLQITPPCMPGTQKPVPYAGPC